MSKDRVMFVLGAVFFCAAMSGAGAVYSQTGMGVDLSPGSYLADSKNKAEKKEPDPFVKELSKKTGADISKLEKLFFAGYGRTEMVAMVLISQKGNADFDAIVKMRDEFVPLRKISSVYGLSYNSIKKEAKDIKLKVEDIIYSQGYMDALKKSATRQNDIEADKK